MSRLTDRMLEINNRKGTFLLQLTAMSDMFTIMLVFLLKSFSTSAVNITPADGLMLPTSSSYTAPIEALKIVVSQKAVFVEDLRIIELENGKFVAGSVSKEDPDFVPVLFTALEKEMKKSEEIAQKNETVQFTGQIMVQADQALSYEVLKKVMYTASMAGYSDLKLATMSSE